MFKCSAKEQEKSQRCSRDAGRKVKPLDHAFFSAKTKSAFLILL